MCYITGSQLHSWPCQFYVQSTSKYFLNCAMSKKMSRNHYTKGLKNNIRKKKKKKKVLGYCVMLTILFIPYQMLENMTQKSKGIVKDVFQKISKVKCHQKQGEEC